MTFAPDTLRAARSLLIDNLDIHPTGSYPADLDPAEVGIVGDTAHAAKGTSYHLGKDQLTSTAYSRKTARDRAGLSNSASAVDVGEFRVTTAKGTFTQRDLAMWSVDQCQVNAPDTRDIREIIYSPDGKRVLRYDRERGYASEPREGEADDSHLFHDHYSQYRDAEGRYTLRDHFARWLTHIGLIGDDMAAYDDYDKNAVRVLDNRVAAIVQGLDDVAGTKDATQAKGEDVWIVRHLKQMGADIAALKAAPQQQPVVTDEQLERVLRKVIGGVDGASPAV